MKTKLIFAVILSVAPTFGLACPNLTGKYISFNKEQTFKSEFTITQIGCQKIIEQTTDSYSLPTPSQTTKTETTILGELVRGSRTITYSNEMNRADGAPKQEFGYLFRKSYFVGDELILDATIRLDSGQEVRLGAARETLDDQGNLLIRYDGDPKSYIFSRVN